MMIPHHAQAVAMSDIILAKEAVDPAVHEVAARITTEQAAEADQMRAWLDGWGEPEEPADGEHSDHETSNHETPDHMGGMSHPGMDMPHVLSLEEMQELEDASPRRATQIYLEYMISHHSSAIDMARTELAEGANPVALEAADQVVRTQTLEVAHMEDLLDG